MRRVSPTAELAWGIQLDDYPAVLACAPDGKRVAVGLASGDIVVVDVASGEVERRMPGHPGGTLALSWHPREPLLASVGADGAVRTHQGSESQLLVGPSATWVEHAAWSPKGKRLATAQGPVVSLWEPDGRYVASSPPLESTVAALAWSPDGTRVAAAAYGGVRMIDPHTAQVAARLDYPGSMLSVVWSCDGKFVACGCQDGTVHFWRTASNRDAQMSGYPAKPAAISFRHDGKLLATAGAPIITLWPFDRKGPEGRTPLELDGHTELVTQLAFAPHVDVLASGCKGGTIALWIPGGLERPFSTRTVPGRVTAIAWSADARAGRLSLVAAGSAGDLLAIGFAS